MGIDNIKKGYPHIDPYSKGMDIHGPTYEDKLKDQVHQSEMGNRFPGQFYTDQVLRAENEGLLTNWGVPEDISVINRTKQILGIDNPITNSMYGYGAFKDKTNEEILTDISTGSPISLNVLQSDRFKFDRLLRRGLIEGPDGVLKYGGPKQEADRQWQRFRQNPDQYRITRNVSNDITRLNYLEDAGDYWGDITKDMAGNVGLAFVGMDNTIVGNQIPLDSGAAESITGAFGEDGTIKFDSNNGLILLEADKSNYQEFEKTLAAYHPDFAEYQRLLKLREDASKVSPDPEDAMTKRYSVEGYLDPKIKKLEDKIFNKDGTVTLMDGLFPDHVRILKDARANRSTQYAWGQLLQLGIEFVPGIGLIGISGIKKAGQLINLAYKGGKLVKSSIADLKSAGLTTAQIKAIEAKNAETVISRMKLKYDPESGTMQYSNPNVAQMELGAGKAVSKQERINIIKKAAEENPNASYAELAKITGFDARRVGDALGPATKIEAGDAGKRVSEAIDWNLSRDENLKIIKELGLKTRKGDMSSDSIKRYINQAYTQKYQLPVDDYADMYRGMFFNRKYDPTIQYGDNWNDPIGILPARTSANALSNYHIPNQQLAKNKVAMELADDLDIPVEQAREMLQARINSNVGYRKKDKAYQALLAGRGTPEGDLAWARYTAGLAENKAKYRETIQANVKNLHPSERAMRTEQRTYAKFVNDLTVNDKEFQKLILNNKELMSVLGTKVDPKTGTIINTKVDVASLFSKETDSRLFEIDHIKEVHSNIGGIEFPANRQLIFQPLHRNFKQPSVEFIEKLNSKVLDGKVLTKKEIDNVKAIIVKAEELGISMRPNVADGFLTQFGVNGKVINPKAPGSSGVDAFKSLVEERIPEIKSMDHYRSVYKAGGPVREYHNTGTRDGELVGDQLKGETIYGEYLKDLNISMEKRIRDQEHMDQIMSAPKSMQGAVATTLYDERQMAFLDEIRELPYGVRAELKKKILDDKAVQKAIADSLRDPRPVRFPLKSIHKLITKNAGVRHMLRQQMLPQFVFQAFIKDLMNKGENPEEIAPNALSTLLTPTGSTPSEQAYIDGFDEFNRALDTGVTNIAFNTMDLILGGVDLASFGNTNLSEKLRDLYDKRQVNDPETFVGDMVSLLVEFGVPGGLVAKLATRAQKAMRIKGFNTMTRFVDPNKSKGAQNLIKFSNIASRMGTGAVVFAGADFVAGGPFNSLNRMFPDDATLLPGKPEQTDDLTGNDLVKANFRNRLRFAADGAMIGGLFPLLGPPIWGLAKGIGKLPFKTIPGINRSVVGGALQLAGVPLRIGADVLAGKVPYTQKMIPAVGKVISKTGEKTASAIQQTAAFIGKNVFARAALAAQDTMFFRDSIYSGINRGSTFLRGVGIPKVFGGDATGLPPFQEWRKFSLNSADPLHANLARIDNKLALFRDIGKLTKDAFGISNKANLFIKAKSRTIDKLYTNLEQITYTLAKRFEEQHKKWGQFDTIQKQYLDDVLDFMQGNKKFKDLDPALRESAVELKSYVNKLTKEFKDLLPNTDPLKRMLTEDINNIMRRSFATFTNSNFRPGAEAVKAASDYVYRFLKQDSRMIDEARIAFPRAKSVDEALRSLAELKVGDLMHIARYEMEDPIRAFKRIAERLQGSGVKGVVDPMEIYTGQELPAVIRKLMGEEKNLKNALMQTTGNIISSTQQKIALDRLAKMGLESGWLFNTAEEALTKGKLYNAIPLGDIKGAGFLPSDILGLFGSPEMIKQLSGYSIFDSALKYKFYQNLLAFKSMVQGGKTLYSPATQMRNFGSAGLFAMNVGHIGGNTSVTQSFKMMLDDIFGSGPGVDQSSLIKWIERKIELGVLDENVVAQELGGVLRDLKSVIGKDGKPVISNFNKFTQRVGDSKITQTVQRLYAGGDNVWKAYGHEFYMSELKQFTKSLDDVHRFFETQVGRKWDPMSSAGVPKTLSEGIEEMGAHLLRETYPTYSRVPPAIQALRKLPIGNFISFPAEMIRTTLATTASSMKMIGSGNPGLQAMGYRALMGQFTTLYGFNHGAQKLASKFTGIQEDKLRAYQDDLGPSFLEDHVLIPISKQNKDGTFKVFDASTYNPYNYLTGPIESFLRQLNSTRLDPAQVDSELDRRFFDAAGPWYKLIDPFIGETIALEPILDIYARNGVTRDGRKIFSELDSPSDKREKAIYHTLETIAPGFVRSAGQVMGALNLDTKGGRVMELGDVLIRLMGGSIMNVDPVTALDYKALDIREIRSAAYQTEHFFSKENALERGPILNSDGRKTGHVMANEFRDIQDEAFVAQFGIWKMFQKSLNSGLLTRDQIETVLGPDGRNVPNLDNLLDGYFTPVSYSAAGLEKRANDLIKEYAKKGIRLNYNDLFPETDLDMVIYEYEDKKFIDFLDPDRPPIEQNTGGSGINLFGEQAPVTPEVEPLEPYVPDTQTAEVPVQTVAASSNAVNPTTGLTKNESALLSPSEKTIRKTQRNII